MTLNFKIKVDNKKRVIECPSNSSLLTALHKNGIEAMYHCKQGFCGACRAKIYSGTIEYVEEPLAYIRSGEQLTCCARPTSDIEIEVIT